MTAPAASSQLGWLLKHLDALTDEELLKFNREVSRRAAAIYTARYANERRSADALAAASYTGTGRGSAA